MQNVFTYKEKRIYNYYVPQELGDADPLTLAQVHEHLVRSPPPASWPNSTAFHFPHQDQNTTPSRNDVTAQFKSPLKTPSHRGNEHGLSRSEPSTDIRGERIKESRVDCTLNINN